MFDDDGSFSPRGVTGHIVFLLIGIIIVGVLCGIVLNMVYDVDTEGYNGPGIGIPMASASQSTEGGFVFTQTENGVDISGSYEGTVEMTDGLLLLANNQVLYLSDGVLHYYNGLTDSVVSEFTAVLGHGKLNNISYEWLYYPNEEGAYRAYDGSVAYEVDDSVAGIGSSNGNVIISMNDTVDSNNSGNDVFVYIDRSEEGIEGIYYRWE